MGVTVRAVVLRHEMARRGWNSSALARAAGLSPATVSAVLSGKPVAADTLRRIADALAKTPGNRVLDHLLCDPEAGGLD